MSPQPKSLVISALALALSVHANAFTTYNIAHQFNIAPSAPNVAFAAQWQYSYAARADDTSPANSVATNSGNGPVVGPVGGAFGDMKFGTAIVPWANSYADTAGTLNAVAIGAALSGSTTVTGWADVYPPAGKGARASAYSESSFNAAAGLFKAGVVTWNPNWRTRLGASAGTARDQRGRIGDPLSYRFFDSHHGWTEGTLISINADVWGSGSQDQEMSWQSGVLQVDVRNADFSLNIGDRFTLQQGTASFSIRNGLVTVSDDSGIFEGMMPTLGTNGMFAVPIGNLSLNVDFGQSASRTSFSLHGDGEALEAVPEPATGLVLLGAIGLVRRRRQR